MKVQMLIGMVVVLLGAGCASVPADSEGNLQQFPQTMPVIEGAPESPSAVESLGDTLAKLEIEKNRNAILFQEIEGLRATNAELSRKLSEATESRAALQAQVQDLTGREQRALDELLTSELEKAVMERHLLEIRLADLQGADGDGAR